MIITEEMLEWADTIQSCFVRDLGVDERNIETNEVAIKKWVWEECNKLAQAILKNEE